MTTPTKTLAGKVALVTGGSRSIGAAIAKRLAADGAAVALTFSASPDKADAVVRAIQEKGGKAIALKADAGNAAEVKEAVARTVAELGRLDILLNNAGIVIVKPVEEVSLADFDRIVDVNVKGVFVATQAALAHLGQGGRIINIGSVNSDRVPFAGAGLYALSKAAVLGPDDKALALDRLYLIGSRPIGLVQVWLDPAIAAIPRARAAAISTADMLRESGMVIERSEISIRAETAGAATAKLLRISPRAAVLVHLRRCLGADGAAREVARLAVCSDSYEFVASTPSLHPSGRSPLESLFDIRTVETV